MALPILDFLVTRMTEYDNTFEHRPGTAFSDLFMQPLTLIMQPLRDEYNDIFVNQSLKRISDLQATDFYQEDSVDDIISNVYVYRRTGSKSSGSARLFFTSPIALDYLIGELTFKSSAGNKYINTLPISITKAGMNNNTDQEFYYLDVIIAAESEGIKYDAKVGEIIESTEKNSFKVFNSVSISGGIDREKNTEYMARAQKSIGVRDLNTGKGLNAIIFETFLSKVTELQAIGMGDPEMMRDIVFNYHIGGRIDGWVKTPNISDNFFNAFGLTIDFTRRIAATRNLKMNLTTNSLFNVQNIDVTSKLVEAFNIDDLEQAAVFFSSVDLETGIDLSSLQFIGLSLDSGVYSNIKISGAVPANTRVGEIVNRLNIALGVKAATIAINPIIINRRRTGNIASNSIGLSVSPRLLDPTVNIFSNTVIGDTLNITVGSNAGIYTVTNVISDNEIELNAAFQSTELNVNYTISRTGTFIKIVSTITGINSAITIGSPLFGSDALLTTIGLAASINPYVFSGKGTFPYIEGTNFSVDLVNGTSKRLLGPTIVASNPTGRLSENIFLEDTTLDVFLNVEPRDLVTITSVTSDVTYEKDYRVTKKINNNRVQLDSFIPFTETGVTYSISRTAIKDKEFVFYTFEYNPLAIDVGNLVQLDSLGRQRGIRAGRDTFTIKDTAFLWITSVELIDPISGEPSGTILNGSGGFGQGGFGQGGFGIGSKAQYVLKVNKPEHRFSAFEDSVILIDSAYLGQSFRVNYKYVPDIVAFHDFAQSDTERVLDGDVLMRHFIPGVVSLKATYSIDPTNSTIVSSAELSTKVANFINTAKIGSSIDASDIAEVILASIDPTGTKQAKVANPIELSAIIHNTDGTRTTLSSQDSLAVLNDVIPSYTTRPLSARTVHWIAGTITLTKV